MTRGIGVPLKFDKATLEGDYGHFARILIKVDLSKPLHESIMIEVGEDYLFPTLHYENVPNFCSVCSTTGHTVASCRHTARNTTTDTTELKDMNLERGRSKILQEYMSKDKLRDVSTTRVFATIKSAINGKAKEDMLEEVVNFPLTSGNLHMITHTLDMATSTNSLRPICLRMQ
ncbi:hypothetical protein Dsin_012727 [Dipteronia sinensis]|uniref:Zinc knuckle CX2CX4HX4C domain-containing protein n=1 Tax=Dipteronia sinensis TaxID=43782 RepID=A0AAE0AJX5_9ROSI|nr:hypothetical protein Dsin_012727 [Dipteronia sinensis]